MNTFTLRLQDATHEQIVEHVSAFVGEDHSGSFGILAGHAQMVTTLIVGLARFRTRDGRWNYLAAPGAVLHFRDNVMRLATRHYLLDDDYLRISAGLQRQLLAEEEQLQVMKESLRQMEQQVLRHLWMMGRTEAGL